MLLIGDGRNFSSAKHCNNFSPPPITHLFLITVRFRVKSIRAPEAQEPDRTAFPPFCRFPKVPDRG